MRFYLINLLCVIGIKQTVVSRSKFSSFLWKFSHPFPIFMHLMMIYKGIILILTEKKPFLDDSKSRIFSVSSSILSVLLWHTIYSRRSKIYSLLKNCHQNSVCQVNTKSLNHISSHKIIVCLISFNFVIVLILPTCIAFAHSISSFIDTWLLGFRMSESEYIIYVIIFIFFFLYFVEFILPSTIFLLLFCFLTLKLANYLEESKTVIKMTSIWHDSISYHCHMHEKLIKRVESYDKTFSLPIFIHFCFTMTIAFTGLALELEHTRMNYNHVIEGVFYMYFSIVTIIAVINNASKVPQQLEEISMLYRKYYEHIIGHSETPFTSSEVKKLAILKVIYKRPILHLTAGRLFRLDKNFLFTVFGTMLTYGFLIIQLRDK